MGIAIVYNYVFGITLTGGREMYWFNRNFCGMFLSFVLLLFLLTGCGAGGGGGNSGSNTNSNSTPPSAPTVVTAIAGDGQATLSWNAVSKASSYNLYMASASGVNKSNYSSLPDGMKHAGITSPYIHTGLVNGKAYYFVVTAVNADGESNESVQVSAIPTSPKGNLSGKLLVGPSLSQASKALPKATETEESNVQQSDFVVGEVMVKLKQVIMISEGVTKLQETFKAEDLQVTSEISIINAVVLRANIYDAFQKGTLSKEEARQKTLDLIQRIQSLPFIEYAEPNYIRSTQAIPNDQYYSKQWHYKTIALPQAWDITTGDSSVIVAVLDSGVRFNHPDLKGNLLSTGYDFVSDSQRAEDNNGIDPDPTDPSENNHYHGTHVAGTIAAVSNNRIGVAGVAWNVKIMPVRVLGLGGGTDADIMQGLLYAAGLTNSSGTVPSQRAKIINMSLGGPIYNSLVQEIINQVVGQGVTVIAAAGNNATEGNPINYPCAYNNVICVGAVGPSLTRASYSEYNSYVDVVAPGGEGGFFTSNDVLSTTWDDATNQPNYKFMPGTSMATPHVSGVAALMLSKNPSLSPSQIEQILTGTALDLGTSGKDEEYGYGLVNAFLAVNNASGDALPGTPKLYTNPAFLYLTSTNRQESISVLNLAGGSLIINNVVNLENSDGNWLSTYFDKSVAPVSVTATVNPSGLSPGVYGATITITTNAGDEEIPVIFDSRTAPNLGTVAVGLFNTSGNLVAETTTSQTQGYAYQFTNLEPGLYLVIAGTDRNGSGGFGDNWGEFIGMFPLLGSPSPITVEAGKTTGGIDVSMQDIGDLFLFDGNGLGPINGAILVTVLDDTGEPVEGAKVYVGDGSSFSGTTNFFGRTTILGSFSGPQTVTATATEHTTSTFYQTNASYLTFMLSRIKPLTTTLAVTLSGLSIGEYGCIWIAMDQYDCAAYTGINPTLYFTVPQDTPLTLSAIGYNAIYGTPVKSDYMLMSKGINAFSSVTLLMNTPTDWHYSQGWVNLPSGNFDKTSAINWIGYSYAYQGLFHDPIVTGWKDSPYFTSSLLADKWFDIWVAKTDKPEYNALGVFAQNSLGEASGTYAQSSFDQLPSSATYNLYDVPSLTIPWGYGVASSVTPVFLWYNTFQPSIQGVIISDPASGYEWEIDVPGTTTIIALPDIPTGGLSGGTTYEWKVMNLVSPNFDYNNFDMKYVMQNLWGLSVSHPEHFVTP